MLQPVCSLGVSKASFNSLTLFFICIRIAVLLQTKKIHPTQILQTHRNGTVLVYWKELAFSEKQREGLLTH